LAKAWPLLRARAPAIIAAMANEAISRRIMFLSSVRVSSVLLLKGSQPVLAGVTTNTPKG
jgi:hypothetical protein